MQQKKNEACAELEHMAIVYIGPASNHSCTQGNNSLQRYNKVIADKFREQCQLNSNRTCFIT